MILYRYKGYDEYNIKFPMELKVHRETKCMYVVYRWSDGLFEKEKFIPKAGKKRYAYPTKKEAMVNYKARKRSQIEWSIRNIKLAEKGLFNAGVTVTSVLKKQFKLDILDE